VTDGAWTIMTGAVQKLAKTPHRTRMTRDNQSLLIVPGYDTTGNNGNHS